MSFHSFRQSIYVDVPVQRWCMPTRATSSGGRGSATKSIQSLSSPRWRSASFHLPRTKNRKKLVRFISPFRIIHEWSTRMNHTGQRCSLWNSILESEVVGSFLIGWVWFFVLKLSSQRLTSFCIRTHHGIFQESIAVWKVSLGILLEYLIHQIVTTVYCYISYTFNSYGVRIFVNHFSSVSYMVAF